MSLSDVYFGEMAPPAVQTYTLPPLPYAYDALEPYIAKGIMHLHHEKHHRTYVTKLNAALASYAAAGERGDVGQQLSLLQSIKFNGGGHVNHALFWPALAAANSEDAKPASAPKLVDALVAQFGSVEGFHAALGKALLDIQGSGWGWLVKDAEHGGRLSITTTKDQDTPQGDLVLGIDMWEHAYYLQYYNGKADYVAAIWNVLNWTTAEARFTGARSAAVDYITITQTE